ncbi:hypothetical protein N219_09565 [Limosilactobacillus fermentum MTCC 8711]|nr:hypothetical protein N219_09565 [Limosilactobacillus fermentum MTCC 8711]
MIKSFLEKFYHFFGQRQYMTKSPVIIKTSSRMGVRLGASATGRG